MHSVFQALSLYDIDIGVSTVSSDQFIVGQRAVVTCSSDSGVVEMIEWQSGGQVVASATSVQQLQLVLDPVNDTIHGSEVICLVTRRANERANQSLSISVTGKLY